MVEDIYMLDFLQHINTCFFLCESIERALVFLWEREDPEPPPVETHYRKSNQIGGVFILNNHSLVVVYLFIIVFIKRGQLNHFAPMLWAPLLKKTKWKKQKNPQNSSLLSCRVRSSKAGNVSASRLPLESHCLSPPASMQIAFSYSLCRVSLIYFRQLKDVFCWCEQSAMFPALVGYFRLEEKKTKKQKTKALMLFNGPVQHDEQMNEQRLVVSGPGSLWAADLWLGYSSWDSERDEASTQQNILF